MAVQVTIIGLGRTGASIGLALGEHRDQVFRVGHDKKTTAEKAAFKMGAVDKVEHNLPRAVKDAQIVVLSHPINELRATLDYIRQDLQPGTLVLDTAPVKAGLLEWVRDALPEGCYYVGLVPATGALFLMDAGSGLDSAGADQFSRSIFLVDAPPGTPGDAVQLASDFVRLLGAQAVLADLAESDGIVAAVHLLPILSAAALLNSTIDQPGWRDARKIAGRAFALATAAVKIEDVESLQMLLLHDRQNVIHALDTLMDGLHSLRTDLDEQNEAGLKKFFESAHAGREGWMEERVMADWAEMKHEPTNYPSMSEIVLGSLGRRRSTSK